MLKGKVALITGASRGIGESTAELFARNGAVVYANAREPGAIDDLCDRLSEYGATVAPLYFDVTDATGIKSAVLRIKKEQGRLDCLVNNAGIMKDALIGMIDGKVMRRTFEVNVYAVIELTQLAARIMKSGASVINIASIAGTNGNKGQVVYAASKGAVIALTKSAAKELAPGNIRVNAIAPGSIDTDLFRAIGADKIPAFESSIGMGRLGKPEDVAKVALFLASDLSEYVTGQIIGADGAAIM